jgi:hypothetical protein
MALQPDAHPAQIKDSVASKSIIMTHTPNVSQLTYVDQLLVAVLSQVYLPWKTGV